MYQTGQGKQMDQREAATNFRRALEYDPTNPYANYGLGFSLFDLGQYDEALTYYQYSLEHSYFDEDKSNAHTGIGVCYEQKRKYNNAREHFNEALKLDPNNQWALDGLSRVK